MVSMAIQVFPAPVGAVTRQSDAAMAATASVWKRSGVKGLFGGTPMPAKTDLSRASIWGVSGLRGCAPLGFGRRREG